SWPLCDHELTKLRSFNERVSKIARVVPQTFVGKEEEQLVLDYRAADAAGKLAKQVFNPDRRRAFCWVAADPAILIECVKLGIVVFENAASMKLVRSVLRNDLNLSPAISTVLRGIWAGDDPDLLYRFLVRRHNCRAAVGEAVDADSIDIEVVG